MCFSLIFWSFLKFKTDKISVLTNFETKNFFSQFIMENQWKVTARINKSCFIKKNRKMLFFSDDTLSGSKFSSYNFAAKWISFKKKIFVT